MHVLAIRLYIVGPEAAMVKAILGMSVLTVVGLSTCISLLPVSWVVRTGRILLMGTGWRSVIALRVLIEGLRGRLQLVSLEHTFGRDESYTLAVGVCG